MLELRPGCECCDRDLPPDSTEARICSFECTFCAGCADVRLAGVCPNCGGELLPRPRRPANKLARNPPSTQRVFKPLEPFVREAGSGPGVVCFHSNASSSGQWRELMELLAPRFHVLAPDAYGSGKSREWPSDRVIRLRDEVALLEPVLQRAGSPVALVGHSYGAAVALIAALANPGRVRALALYEPTLFSLLDAEAPPPNEGDGIRNTVAAAGKALDQGNQEEAARLFIDYWMGAGSWAQMPEPRRAPIAASVANVRRWAHALTTEPTPLSAFRSLDIPVLYMVGKRSTASALGVARLLAGALPRVERLEFDELGHMGPVTHPAAVNQAIARFLERQTATEREFVHARLIDAPRERVFSAFSDPGKLARWWGPNGFSSSFQAFDLRPGGAWRFVMHGPDGTDHPNESVFVEVVAPERIVFEHLSGHHFQMTLTFEAQGSKTLVGWRQRFDSAAEYQRIASVVKVANEQNLDRLEALVLGSP